MSKLTDTERGRLIYDADCGFCSRSALWLDPHAITWSSLDLAELNVTQAQADANAGWLVDGHVKALGADAIAEALKARSHFTAAIGVVIRAPGVRTLSHVVYRVIAENRHRMPGGTPACAVPPRGD